MDNNTIQGNIKSLTENGIRKVINSILSHGVDGAGPLSSSTDLAQEYKKDTSYKTIDERVNALIKWEASKNFGTGFVTGLGGLITLPVSIPASLYSSWLVQARLAGAVAVLNGYSTSEDRVRTYILLAMIGDAGKEVLKDAGMKLAKKAAMNAVQSIPATVLKEVNKRVGFNLLARGSSGGIVNLAKIVPVAGGLVGGIMNTVSCVIVGKAARRIFRTYELGEGGILGDPDFNIRIDEDKLSRIVKANLSTVKSVTLPGNGIIEIKFIKVPVRFRYKLIEFSEGTIKLKSSGNMFKRVFFRKVIHTKLNKLPDNLKTWIYFSKGILTVDINELLKNQGGIDGVFVEDIEIRKDALMVLLG